MAPEDFQMAPMIDMVFLLLVFFMCVSSLSQADRSVEVALAESERAKVPEDLANRGSLTIRSDGDIFIGTRQVKTEDLASHVEQALKENATLRLNIRVDASTAYRDVRTVLKICAEAGAHDIIYATYQSGASSVAEI